MARWHVGKIQDGADEGESDWVGSTVLVVSEHTIVGPATSPAICHVIAGLAAAGQLLHATLFTQVSLGPTIYLSRGN